MSNVKRLLCAFHAKIAWARNMKEKVVPPGRREQLAKALDQVMRCNDLPPSCNTDEQHIHVAARQQKDGLYDLLRSISPDEKPFLAYFQAVWEPKAGKSWFSPRSQPECMSLVSVWLCSIICIVCSFRSTSDTVQLYRFVS